MTEREQQTRTVVLKVDQKVKARWVATSAREGMKLLDWMEDTLTSRAWFDDERPKHPQGNS